MAFNALRQPLPRALKRTGDGFFLDVLGSFLFLLLCVLMASTRPFREFFFMCRTQRRAAFDHVDAVHRTRRQT